MSDLIKRDDALHIVDVAEDEHPYKVPGLFVTYSEYNQGWSDAVDFIALQHKANYCSMCGAKMGGTDEVHSDF